MLFVALRQHFRPGLWCNWPVRFRDRNKQALASIKRQLRNTIEKEKFLQYQFLSQWLRLKKYCKRCGIKIIGDIPIYVAYDSADAWAHPEIFKLTAAKKPKFVTGVPPDCFSKTGQLWGNPVYNWELLKKKGYRWWIRRIGYNLKLFDMVRLDHFRGFVDYWQVPAHHKTAQKGKWVTGPKQNFLKKLVANFTASAFVLEDLGNITVEVRKLIEKFQLTSMKVLMFGFDGDLASNPHCPFNHIKNSVVYTGTHDTNTIKGWYRKQIKTKQKKRIPHFLGHKPVGSEIHWELIRLTFSSVSRLAIIPMQDILGLGQKARMNLPGTMKGNWQWRFTWKQVRPQVTKLRQKLKSKDIFQRPVVTV